jgi:hypothetical protein
MKYCIFILKFSIGVLLISLATYIYFFMIGDSGLEPIEPESIVLGIFTILGVISAILLAQRAGAMRATTFYLSFVAYFLLFTFPAVVSTLYMWAMMTAG